MSTISQITHQMQKLSLGKFALMEDVVEMLNDEILGQPFAEILKTNIRQLKMIQKGKEDMDNQKINPLDFFKKTTSNKKIITTIEFVWDNPLATRSECEHYLRSELDIGWDTIRKEMPKEIGYTPRKAFEILKLEKVALLIVRSKKSISKVLKESKIDIPDFNKKFENRFKMSPEEYRSEYSQF